MQLCKLRVYIKGLKIRKLFSVERKTKINWLKKKYLIRSGKTKETTGFMPEEI